MIDADKNTVPLRFIAAVTGIAASCVLLASASALAQPQSSAQAKCLTLLSKRVARVVKAQGKEIDACAYDLAQGIGNRFACLTADTKGRIAKATQKLADVEANACAEMPDFGYIGASELVAAATAHRIALVEYSTTLYEPQYFGAPCVRSFLKGAGKLLGAKLRGFGECLANGLGDGSIQTGDNVVDCFSAFDSSSDAKLSKIISSLASELENKRCEQIPLCFHPDPALCADEETTCRACQTLRIGGSLTVHCDLLDDGVANSYCASACGDGEIGAPWGGGGLEQCDDGNRASGDGCDSNCTPSECGNGLPAGGETCDAAYGSLVGGVCVGGAYGGAACSWNAECEGGYCTSCPNRYSCEADCSGCATPLCTVAPSGCSMVTGACIGQSCVFLPPFPCDNPYCGTEGNCTINGICVPTGAENCAEYEGVLGTCLLGS